MEKNFNLKLRLYLIVRTRQRQENHKIFIIVSKLEYFNPKLTKFSIFQHSETFHDLIQKNIENLEFIQCVKF